MQVPLDSVLAEQAYMLFYIKSEPQQRKKEVNAMGKKSPHSDLNGRIPFMQKSLPTPCAGANGPVMDSPPRHGPLLSPVADLDSGKIKSPRPTFGPPNLETKAPLASNGAVSPHAVPLQNGLSKRTVDGVSRREYSRCNGNGLISDEHQPAAVIAPATTSSEKVSTVCTHPIIDHPSKAKQQRRSTGRGQSRTSPPLGVRNMHKKKKSPR